MTVSYFRNKDTDYVVETSSPDLWNTRPDYEKITARFAKDLMRKQAIAHLKQFIKPNTTVCTILRHVSASGMSREISLCIVAPDKSIMDVTYFAGIATGYKKGKRNGLLVTGCGMDMGFHLVYQLGCALWPTGTPEPHGTRNGEPDTAGGYALNHRWL